MHFFDYDRSIKNVEYYEILENLMERWEHEIVEFKEAKGNYDTDKIGRYFSAISNEANLRQQQYGWLIFGVSEKNKVKHVVGTAYKKGDRSLLEKFKYEIARDTTNGMTFFDIIEIFPMVNGKEYRVLMFKIPAAATGIPTDWLIRELLNNCIVHTNYQLGGRIYVNEFDDKIKFTNPGNFIPQRVENVLEVSYNPPFYRNQLLAESMVAFHMIDTATLGIRRAYNIQKAKYFPMPDYEVTSGTQVGVTVYGKTLNDNYMHILYDHPELDLHTVFLLDRVQKGLPIQKEDVDKLRSLKLVEGRITSLYLSASAAKSISDGAGYIKNKGFDDKYYKDLIVEYLKQYDKARKKEIRELLWDKLPDALSEKQKENKIRNLLYSLKQKQIIETDSTNQQKSNWILKK